MPARQKANSTGANSPAASRMTVSYTHLHVYKRQTDKPAGRFALAADSLALYTDAGFRLSAGIALAMMVLALAWLLYTSRCV